jgi:hypothetical protein
MAEWIIEIPSVVGSTPTLVPAESDNGQKQDFWMSTMAMPSDPFFDVTSGLDTVVVAARAKSAKTR